MHKQKSFPLRIGDHDRRRARRLAQRMGLSENRLYSDLIQEGLLVREQMAYFQKLRAMRVPAVEGLALLDLAPDVPPDADDALPKARRVRRRAGATAALTATTSAHSRNKSAPAPRR